jgi:DNA-binding Xre family transcriptional regulator
MRGRSSSFTASLSSAEHSTSIPTVSNGPMTPSEKHWPVRADVSGFWLMEMVAGRELREGRRVTFDEIAGATRNHRTTLSQIANRQGYNITTANLGQLCQFFGCGLDQLADHAFGWLIWPGWQDRWRLGLGRVAGGMIGQHGPGRTDRPG